jgi:ABC-2 type transport system ATP-binding protein
MTSATTFERNRRALVRLGTTIAHRSATSQKGRAVTTPRDGDPEAVSKPKSHAIEVADLRMRYGDREVLTGIDLTVSRGEILAILGPNGAGKTTTIEILEGYRQRSGGTVAVLGEDPATAGPAWRARIGVVLQESAPERDLTVAECVALYRGYYPNPRPVAEVLDLVGLSDQARLMAGRLSGGQQRRLDVGLALVGRPELVFLDEPTTGFDPSARRAAWEMIAGLRRLGTTIILTTHYMEEAERLADRVVVVADGHIVATGTPATIAGRVNAATQITFAVPDHTAFDDLPDGLRAVSSVEGSKVHLATSTPLDTLEVLLGWAKARRVDLPDLEVRHPSLEDVYLQITNKQGEDR